MTESTEEESSSFIREKTEEREILTNDKSHVRHESRFPPLLRPQIQSPFTQNFSDLIFSPFLDFSHSSLLLYLRFIIISSKNVKSSLGLQLALSQSSFFKINSQYRIRLRYNCGTVSQLYLIIGCS